jgi:hypothetical protein
MIGIDDAMMFVPESWGNDAAKVNFAQTARLMSIAYAEPAVQAKIQWLTYEKGPTLASK